MLYRVLEERCAAGDTDRVAAIFRRVRPTQRFAVNGVLDKCIGSMPSATALWIVKHAPEFNLHLARRSAKVFVQHIVQSPDTSFLAPMLECASGFDLSDSAYRRVVRNAYFSAKTGRFSFHRWGHSSYTLVCVTRASRLLSLLSKSERHAVLSKFIGYLDENCHVCFHPNIRQSLRWCLGYGVRHLAWKHDSPHFRVFSKYLHLRWPLLYPRLGAAVCCAAALFSVFHRVQMLSLTLTTRPQRRESRRLFMRG